MVSNKLEIMVATHIVNADKKPYIENKMIRDTIESCHSILDLKDTLFKIYPDARFKKTHPELMKKYESYLTSMCKELQAAGINVKISEKTDSLLRGNWQTHVETTKKDYMMFLEHDWKFVKKIDVEKIIKCFDKNNYINYIRLPRFDLTSSWFASMCSRDNWDWICEEVPDSYNLKIPLSRISFISGNPHFSRVKFSKDFIIPEFHKWCPLEKSKGTSHLEKDLKKAQMYMIDSFRDCGYSNYSTDKEKAWGHQWPLSIGNNPGKGCIKCFNAICKQHQIWGNFMYGKKGDKAIVSHLGDWCIKC